MSGDPTSVLYSTDRDIIALYNLPYSFDRLSMGLRQQRSVILL